MATKSDIIRKVIEKYSSLDKRVVTMIIDRFFEILSDALKDHNRIEFRGVASFSIRSYSIKEINYSMSNKFTKNKYFKVYFRSSKSLSNLING